MNAKKTQSDARVVVKELQYLCGLVLLDYYYLRILLCS